MGLSSTRCARASLQVQLWSVRCLAHEQQGDVSDTSVWHSNWCHLYMGTVRKRSAVTPDTTYSHQKKAKGNTCVQTQGFQLEN